MKIPAILVCVLLQTGCFFSGDEPHSYTKLTKDFWLSWWADSSGQHILRSFDENGSGGLIVVSHTVFAVGYSNDFIIAKQHPDAEEEIEARLFNYNSEEGAYNLPVPSDSIWLSGEDSFYKKGDKWFHISNGWNPPDSLKPYRKITNYYLIDIRNYDREKGSSYTVYDFRNKEDFNQKRKELHVPENLDFTLRSPSLE